IFHKHGEAADACAEAALRKIDIQAERTGKLTIAVRQEFKLVLGTGETCPGAHHEAIIDGHDRDAVDAACLEGIEVLDKARQVTVGAGGRECARYAEQHNLATCKEVSRADVLGGIPGNHLDLNGGHALANGYRHIVLLMGVSNGSFDGG